MGELLVFPRTFRDVDFLLEDVAEISVSAAVNDLPDEVRDPSNTHHLV
jgi:hypothetical protein